MKITEGKAGGGVVVSMFDASGAWSEPWLEYGYTVVQMDLEHGDDIMSGVGGLRLKLAVYAGITRADVVLMAPPCTDFALSGARWWAEKDADGRTEESLALVKAALQLKDALQPTVWALENPKGRLGKLLLGPPRLRFHPHHYAGWLLNMHEDAYTKQTCLWGEFQEPRQCNVNPVYYYHGGKRGSWQWAKLGGSSKRTKALRSVTPKGFARAFASANHKLSTGSSTRVVPIAVHQGEAQHAPGSD